MSVRKILCVDDEVNILRAFERQFRRQFELVTAVGSEAGLRAVEQDGPFAVVVSDFCMPGINGVDFLARVRHMAPDTVRVMLTGQANMNDAIAAVNQGQIFRFLTKPATAETLVRTFEAGLEQYRLVTAERELLQGTLQGSIRVMSQILSLVNPIAFSRTERIRRYVLHIAARLGLTGRWEYEMGALLSQIGCVAVPPDVLTKYYDAQPLDANEQAVLSSQGRVGHDLLAEIPRLESVAAMISGERPAGKLHGESAEVIETGSELLRTATAFDELVMRGVSPSAALERLRANLTYRSEFLDALEDVEVDSKRAEARLLNIPQLKPGMMTNADVKLKNGLLLLGKGKELTATAISRLQAFALTSGIEQPISVLIPRS